MRVRVTVTLDDDHVCELETCENPAPGALYCSTWCWDVAGNQPWTHAE